jgi:Domain of unknown function (DUF3859)
MRMRIAIAAFTVFLALWGANIPAAQAEDAHVESLDVLQTGFYTAKTAGERAAPGTAGGNVNAITEIKFLDPQPTDTAKTGTRMGVRFNVVGTPSGGKARLQSIWFIPEPGIHDPETGNTYRQSRSTFEATVGDNVVRGYALEKPFEVIRGTWRLELLQDGRKLLERSFEIK